MDRGQQSSDERQTSSGIPLKLVYSPADLAGVDASALSSQPGDPPYLRGAYPGMYRTKPWRIFQLSGFGNPEDEGARIRFLLEHGETGFIMEHDRNIADHLYDLDHPDVVARKEDVGLTGAVTFCARDYATALDRIPLETVYAHPGGGVIQHAPFTLACYWTEALRRGIPLSALHGTSQADYFLTYIGCIAKQQIPADIGLRFNADTIEFCLEHLPHWVPVSIAGYNGAETGLNGWQELGAVMANAVEYIDAVVARKRHSAAEVAPAVAGVNFRTSMDFFEDIAKLRASRKLWSDLLVRRYGVTDVKARRLRIHSLTAGSAMTYQQPFNNLIRGTVMGLAAALGGTQSLGVSGYDEALSIPSEHAHQMSVRVQQVLQNETRVTSVADPLGGSYFVEALTAEVEGRAWAFFDEIQSNGGFLAVVDSGWLHQKAAENQVREMREMETGSRQIVGINTGIGDVSPFDVEGFQGKSDAWDRGMERLTNLRRTRDKSRASSAIEQLRVACTAGTNILPPMLEAAASDITLGEVGDVFRSVFGDWKIPIAM